MNAAQRWQILRLHVEDQIPLATLARDCGIGERTLQRWHARYQAGGYAALRERTRADRGSRRVEPDVVRLIQRLALTKPRPSAATIHRVVAEHYAATGHPAPSYSTVRSVIASLDPGMVTLALDGPASYRDRHELLLRRRAARPNEVWQADHTMLDITVLDEAGKPVRPWLTIVLDDHSRAVCGYLLVPGAPSVANTALALRQAIWPKIEADWPQCGVPDVLYTDHGSDFTSHRIGDTLNALHIRIIHSAVGRPQGRGKIERFFGTINTELLPRLPGHIAPRTTPAPKLTIPEIDAAVSGFVRAYNARPHRELRESPNTAWTADGWLPRLPDTLEELDGLLLTVPPPAPFSATASTPKACDTPHRPWPPTSAPPSPSATTPATSPRSGSFTTTSSSAPQLMSTIPGRPSASATSKPPAPPTAANSAPRSENTSPSATPT